MAISFSRPDPSSPAAVGSAAFPVTKRGFDQGEVRDFLRMVAAELARLQEREKFLEAEMLSLQTRGMSAPGRLDEETVTTLLGEEAARVLTTARDAGAKIRDRAEEQATRLVKEAVDDAARIREEALLEAARIRSDAENDAENEIEMAKQQGRDMVNEAREYREKVLSELSRRREAARAQIEQLLHDRDRLLNAFERARIASEHVLAGLTEAHEEPEFIVDLSPTTGPIPIVNPAHPAAKVYDHDAEVDLGTAGHGAVPADLPADLPEDVAVPLHEMAVVEAELATIDDVAAGDEAVTIVDHAEHDDVERDELPEGSTLDGDAVVESAVPVSDHPVHESAPVADEGSAPTVDATDDTAGGDHDETSSNVVSIFARRGKSGSDDAAPPTTDGTATDRTTTKDTATGRAAADDIFAKLRAGSTEKVAEQTTRQARTESAEPTPKAPTKKPTAKREKKPVAGPADPAMFATRDEALAPLVTAVARKLKRALADEQNAVLAHLRQKRSSLEIEAVLGTVEEHAARYVAAVAEEAMAAAGAGAASTKTAGGSTKRVTQKAVNAGLATSVAEGLVAAFREDARIAIGEAEGDREVLAGLMRDVYRTWKSEGIDSHVDDVMLAAHGHGAYLALENGATVAWRMAPRSGCCSECEDNSLAGAVVKGDAFPTGHVHAPAHRGCRCLVRP